MDKERIRERERKKGIAEKKDGGREGEGITKGKKR